MYVYVCVCTHVKYWDEVIFFVFFVFNECVSYCIILKILILFYYLQYCVCTWKNVCARYRSKIWINIRIIILRWIIKKYIWCISLNKRNFFLICITTTSISHTHTYIHTYKRTHTIQTEEVIDDFVPLFVISFFIYVILLFMHCLTFDCYSSVCVYNKTSNSLLHRDLQLFIHTGSLIVLAR